jgi:hypothetical protein
MDYLLYHWQLIAVVLGVIILLACYRWVLELCGVIIVPDDSVGVMTKKFVIVGKNRRLPAGRIIASIFSRIARSARARPATRSPWLSRNTTWVRSIPSLVTLRRRRR